MIETIDFTFEPYRSGQSEWITYTLNSNDPNRQDVIIIRVYGTGI